MNSVRARPSTTGWFAHLQVPPEEQGSIRRSAAATPASGSRRSERPAGLEICANAALIYAGVRSHRGRTGPGNAVSQGFPRRIESASLSRIGFKTQTGNSLAATSGTIEADDAGLGKALDLLGLVLFSDRRVNTTRPR